MPMQPQTVNHRRKSERGYILVTLTLFVALLAVVAVAIAPALIFQIRRDREEEMIHRGTQYSRAIRKFFKKFGRYPTSLAELDNTNNLRFLRKHYKDPITGKDFKLLHYSEVQMMSMGAGIPGMTPASGMAGSGMPGASASSTQGFSLGSGIQTSTAQTQATGQGNAPPDSTANGNSPADPSTANSDTANPGGAAGSPSSLQAIGGPIVGVISTSKDKSIREFGGKNHYNQWQFIYDPALFDRSTGLINTPAQPPLQGVVANNSAQGQPGTQAPGMQQAPGTPSSGFGSGSFGSSTNSTGSQPPPAQTPAQTSPSP